MAEPKIENDKKIPNPKYSSIVGTGFPDYVQTQLNLRSQTGNKKKRDNKALQYLTNRNGWFRLSSAAIINDKEIPIGGREEKVANQKTFTTKLAQDFVLQGGSIIINGPEKNQTTLRKGFKGTYQEGETDNLGLQPMPGIVGITIGTGGKWQTFQEAEIDIIVYNLDQLDIIQKLYMSLGVHVLLEWGHSPYLTNNPKAPLTNNIETIDWFNMTDRELITQEITKKRKDTCGNYDGVLGIVYNFNIQGDKDGAYLCKVNIMGPGSAIESLKVPSSTGVDFTNPEDPDNSHKYSSTLDNALYAMDEVLKTSQLYKTTGTDDGAKLNFAKITADDWFTEWKEPGKTSSAGTGAPGTITPGKNKGSWGNLLNDIYNRSSYTPFTFTKKEKISDEIINYNNEFASYGNAAQIITGRHLEKDNSPTTDNLKPLPLDFYTGYIGSFKNNKSWLWGGSSQELTYITFGHLMALINSLGVFTFSTESKKSPILYIDYHPDNTIVNRGPVTATINPFKAMVPFIANKPYQDIFNPLDITGGTIYKWQKNKGESLTSINLSNDDIINRINKVYDPSNFAVDSKPNSGGKLMNVLVSIDYARECIVSTNPNNKTSIVEYIKKILDGINQSCGLVNNFRPYIDECGYILRIVEEKLLNPEKFTIGADQKILELQTFGFDSIVYESSLTTAIGPEIQNQVMIATQGLSESSVKDFPDDLLNFENLNLGVIDRLAPKKDPGSEVTNSPPVSAPSRASIITGTTTQSNQGTDNPELLKTYAFLYKHIYNIYAVKDEEVILLNQTCIDMEIPYSDLLGRQSKIISPSQTKNHNNASTLLPYEYQITLDGISGIMPYSVFRIPNDRLPKAYRNRVVFSVFSINHSFVNNSWRTTLRGQMVFTDDIQQTSTSTTISGTGKPPNNDPRNPSKGVNFPKTEQSSFTVADSPKGEIETPVNNITPPGVTTQFGTVTTGPDGLQSVSFGPVSNGQDINAAFDFIAYEEARSNPKLNAYADEDNTNLATVDLEVASYPFTYRIGYGSDTITNTDGSVIKVKRSSRITPEQAELDLKRRIKVYKSDVEKKLSAKGVNYNELPLKIQVVFIDIAYNYGVLWDSFIDGWKKSGIEGVKAELRDRIRRFNSGQRGQVGPRREAELQYLNN